jgi:hypothetical protein
MVLKKELNENHMSLDGRQSGLRKLRGPPGLGDTVGADFSSVP